MYTGTDFIFKGRWFTWYLQKKFLYKNDTKTMKRPACKPSKDEYRQDSIWNAGFNASLDKFSFNWESTQLSRKYQLSATQTPRLDALGFFLRIS